MDNSGPSNVTLVPPQQAACSGGGGHHHHKHLKVRRRKACAYMHETCRTNAPTHLRAYNDKEPARAASHSAMAGARLLTVTQHRHALTRPPRRDVRPPGDSGGATICSLQQTACREQGHFLPYARCQLNSTTMTAWEARYQPSVPTPATLAKLRPGSSAMDQMDAGQHHSFSFGQLCTHTHTHTCCRCSLCTQCHTQYVVAAPRGVSIL